ncbi:ABC transporter substrate-binding protein [Rhodococcoides yunnanense]|uniref:ABC transporter substrate-binding protein n=1 Tax=Rhodococcoides yunnanense TaxID=278209 RepID=UPI0014757F9C|nr:ABC transporter substrate-binding protein [Rhodococcus yunnanensis]
MSAVGALALGLAMVVSGCSGSESTESDSVSSSVSSIVNGVDVSGTTLRVGIFQDVTRVQTENTEFFDDTPYNIEWVRLNGAGPTVQALGGDAIDISWGLSDTAVPKAAAEAKEDWTAENARLKIVALLKPFDPENYPSGIIAANKDAGISSLEDLRGKSYTFNEGGNAHAAAVLALYKAGLTRDDVNVQLLQSDSIASAITTGAVQAGSSSTSALAAALDAGAVERVATAAEVGFPGYVSIVARSGALADAKIDAAIGDFVGRATKFHKWSAANPDDVADAFVKAQQLTDEQALLAAKTTASTVLPVGQDDPGTKVEVDLTDLLVKSGFLPRVVDVRSLVDDRYSAQIEAGNQ